MAPFYALKAKNLRRKGAFGPLQPPNQRAALDPLFLNFIGFGYF